MAKQIYVNDDIQDKLNFVWKKTGLPMTLMASQAIDTCLKSPELFGLGRFQADQIKKAIKEFKEGK